MHTVDDSHFFLPFFTVTPAGLVTRLIWPGLLLASLTVNLLFACLYVYNQWGWAVGRSATVLPWPARSDSASVLTVDLGARQPCQTASPSWLLFIAQCQILISGIFQCTEKFGGGCFGWKQIWHESQLLKMFLLAPVISPCFVPAPLKHRKVQVWFDFKGSSFALILSLKAFCEMCNAQPTLLVRRDVS